MPKPRTQRMSISSMPVRCTSRSRTVTSRVTYGSATRNSGMWRITGSSQPQLAVLDENAQRHCDERLARRGEREQRVRIDRIVLTQVLRAEALRIHDLIVLDDGDRQPGCMPLHARAFDRFIQSRQRIVTGGGCGRGKYGQHRQQRDEDTRNQSRHRTTPANIRKCSAARAARCAILAALRGAVTPAHRMSDTRRAAESRSMQIGIFFPEAVVKDIERLRCATHIPGARARA